MRKFYIITILLLSSIGVFAQDEVINIPDANFKKALLNHNPVIDTNNDGEIQKSEARKYTGIMYVNLRQIKTLTGIEYFENLTELKCQNNQLTTLNLSRNTKLTRLICYSNKIAELDISKSIKLEELVCWGNELTQLNVSNNTKLKKLNCSGNELTQLDVSKNVNLISLECGMIINYAFLYNQLTQLNISKNVNLKVLNCSNNQLTQLDVSKNINLEYLRCTNNQLTQLDISKNTKLKKTDFSKNTIDLSGLWSIKSSLPLGCDFKYKPQNNIYSVISVTKAYEADYFGQSVVNGKNTTFKWYNVSGELVDDNAYIETVSGTTGKFIIKKEGAYYCQMSNPEFPDLDINTNLICFSSSTEEVVDIPDANFKKCLLKDKTINTNHDGEIQLSEAQNYKGKIHVYSKNIKSLKGIEHFINIYELNCRDNKLTQVDVSKNINIRVLHLGSNKLKQLNISKNIKLYELNCGNNLLKKLDVSNNVELANLYCSRNRLTQLNIDKSIKLYTLDCSANQLTQLDISKNIKLKEVSCSENQLTQLDVLENIRLTRLSCQSNKIKRLDVSKNINLQVFSCGINQLIQLDLSNNSKLERLYCNTCQLTQLDISKNTKLTTLNCENNKLTQLDINKHTLLRSFSCRDNRLTQLDVSKNISLESLRCSYNQLTQLDVSNNPKLIYLYCSRNKLSFSELWSIKENLPNFNYKPQNKLYDEKIVAVDTEIDYSSELNVNGKTTTFVWYNRSTNTEVDETSIKVIVGGKFKFLQEGKYYCRMSNTEFEGFELHTNTITVLKGQSLTFNPPAAAKINTKITLEATASTGLDVTYEIVSGEATLEDNVLTTTTEGTLVIKAVQAGNEEYAKAEKEVTIQVSKHDQTLTFNPSTAIKINDKVTLVATASTGLDVTFELVSGKAKLDGNILTATTEGALVVKAIQTGNEEYGLVEKEVTIQVTKYDQIITLDIQKTAKVNDKITLNATASTGLDVTYQIVSGEATLDGNILTPTAEGTLVVKAIQTGNEEYASVEKEATIQVNKRNQTITFDVKETVKVNDKITLTATASSGLDVAYEIVSGNATLEANTVTFTDAGEVQVKAIQAGNNEYNAVEKTVTITVTKSTAIDNLSVIGAKIYPNPVTDILNIELQETGSYTVTILNSIGDIVTQQTVSSVNTAIDMSAYNSGIYIIKVTTGNRSYTGKIIKQ
jgi:Leucine-rich repeat (LRR) protein